MEWFTHLLKVSICAALFFGFYQLLLRRLTFFKFNRFYLLITLLLSFVIPALQLTIEKKAEAIPLEQYHSLDKIALLFIKAVLWFNPVVYLYDRALEQVHEYEADEATSKNVSISLYANLILNIVISKNISLLHSFAKSPVKERIKMLFSQKSGNMKKISYQLALPLCLSFFV